MKTKTNIEINDLIEEFESQDNCFSAGDMADQAAKAFRHGYRQALIDIANGNFTEAAKKTLDTYDNDTQRTNNNSGPAV